jgi:hypothetical protein
MRAARNMVGGIGSIAPLRMFADAVTGGAAEYVFAANALDRGQDPGKVLGGLAANYLMSNAPVGDTLNSMGITNPVAQAAARGATASVLQGQNPLKGAATGAAGSWLGTELGAQDAVPLTQKQADLIANMAVGAASGRGIPSLITQAAFSGLGSTGTKSKNATGGGDGTTEEPEGEGGDGTEADLDLGTKTITATKPSDPWEFPMPDKVDVPFPELNIEEDPLQLPTVTVRGKFEPTPFTALDPQYPDLPPVELNIAPDVVETDKKVSVPKVPVATTKPTIPSIPTTPGKTTPAPATGTTPSTGGAGR